MPGADSTLHCILHLLQKPGWGGHCRMLAPQILLVGSWSHGEIIHYWDDMGSRNSPNFFSHIKLSSFRGILFEPYQYWQLSRALGGCHPQAPPEKSDRPGRRRKLDRNYIEVPFWLWSPCSHPNWHPKCPNILVTCTNKTNSVSRLTWRAPGQRNDWP